jgi:hypothetical protein
MKKPVKVYLTDCEKKKLLEKAESLGFTGRGKLERLFEKIANEPVAFMDGNARTILKALSLKIDDP